MTKWAVPLAAAVAFITTALFRFLALTGFPNDQFLHLAGAQQMLMGELPTRDFFDPGMPLMYVTSAAAQLLLGRTLFAEAVLVSVAYGLATACTLVASWKVSRSLVVAALATSLCIAIFPSPYSYPKALLYAAAPLVMWAWMASPTRVRLVSLASFVAIAFLFRHDHGIYLTVFALAGIVLTPADNGLERVKRAATFCVLVTALLMPYFVYVQMYEGLAGFVLSGIEYSRREADRTQLHLAALGWSHEARLLYGFHALPVVALCCVWLDVLRKRSADIAVLAPLALLAMLLNLGFLRDPLATRLPDVIGPAVLIGACLVGRALRVRAPALRLAALAVAAVVAVAGADSVFAIGKTGEQFNRTELAPGIGRIPELLSRKTAELTDRFSPRHVPDGRLLPLVPFFQYLDRCTTSRHRLLVVGYAPEIFVYAQRLFGGGKSTFVEGYYDSAAEQQRIIDRTERQVVLFVLELTDVDRSSFAHVYAFVESRFEPMVDVPVAPDRTVRIVVNKGFPPLRLEKTTGWPCYR